VVRTWGLGGQWQFSFEMARIMYGGGGGQDIEDYHKDDQHDKATMGSSTSE
jgi:hypothetical protein